MFYIEDDGIYFDKDYGRSGLGKVTYSEEIDYIVERAVENRLFAEFNVYAHVGGCSSKVSTEIYLEVLYLHSKYNKFLSTIEKIFVVDKDWLTHSEKKGCIYDHIEDGKTLGMYFPLRKEIFINASMVKDLESIIRKDYKDSLVWSAGHVLMHEFAHHLHRNYLSDYAKDKIYSIFRKWDLQRRFKNSSEFFSDCFANARYKKYESLDGCENDIFRILDSCASFNLPCNNAPEQIIYDDSW